MRQPELWNPSKFVLEKRTLKATSDLDELAVSSRHSANQTASLVQRVLKRYARGRLLDLGCGKVPLYHVYRHLVTSITCIDWAHSSYEKLHWDLAQDLNHPLALASSSFDTILISSVLEHICQPQQLFDEIERVLRPKGRALISVPFLYGLHETPWDFFRYTRYGLESMCHQSGLEIEFIEETGGWFDVMATLMAKMLDGQPWHVISAAWYKIVTAASRVQMVKKINQRSKHKFPLGYVLVAKKPL